MGYEFDPTIRAMSDTVKLLNEVAAHRLIAKSEYVELHELAQEPVGWCRSSLSPSAKSSLGAPRGVPTTDRSGGGILKVDGYRPTAVQPKDRSTPLPFRPRITRPGAGEAEDRVGPPRGSIGFRDNTGLSPQKSCRGLERAPSWLADG
jgi:hypothetical protein